VRRHGRHEKTSTLEDIERFHGDVARAAGKVERCEQNLNRLNSAVAEGAAWHLEHDWRYGRLSATEAELTGLGHIDLRTISLPERAPGWEHDRSRTSSLGSRLSRALLSDADGGEVPDWWADRIAKIAAPPLPGRDPGLGMDIGL
jgi:hypothetical protein